MSLFGNASFSKASGASWVARPIIAAEYKSPVPAKHLEDKGFGRNRREGNTTQAEGAKVNKKSFPTFLFTL